MTFPWFGSRKTFAHGIHPPECKDLTRDKGIRRLPFAPHLILPLSQHTGAPAKPIVREGQEVVRGEPIAEPGGFVSVPIHAPVTGIIEKIGLARDARGGMSPAIFIEQYQAANQEILYGAETDIDSLSPAELVKAVQATGVVGLGGAAFPTHVKLALPEGKSVDTVIVNGCECEPFLTTDHRVMIEQVDSIYKGIRVVMRALGAKRAIIGIETNKLDAVEKLRAAIPAGIACAVEAIEAKYPQGAEKMLTKALVDREVPSGGLPIDVGVAVFNVGTLAQIGELLPFRQGLIERVVTVSGTGVRSPGNYLMAIGTPLRFILEQVGFRERECELIFGGPMMGTTIASLDVPVTKGVTGILAIAKDHPLAHRNGRVYPCIKCGACVEACPMHLNPSELGLLARKMEYESMAEQHHLMDCFECGCCSFVCPSNIPLVQYFRVAKAITRERKVSK
ncbi:MAG: electron transport complex subunit RsxC [Candidatus Hydrogenedentes bacterium]|nr:electron transport complex subunit RsxC [Candidatus Hydrogenedentota bacterium]